MHSLDGKVAIVTGASRGLGREMAIRFATEGARVVLVSRTREALEEVATTAPTETLVAPADVSKQSAVDTVVEDTLSAFDQIDVLVNNAAIAQVHVTGGLKSTGELSVNEWETILAVNLSGPFYFARAVLPAMINQGSGNIINITSNAGSHPFNNSTPYVVSKHGLDGLTKQLAVEYDDDGINANGVYPDGAVPTSFQQLDSNVSDDQLADMHDPGVLNDAAVRLASQGPDGVTGEILAWHEWEAKLDSSDPSR